MLEKSEHKVQFNKLTILIIIYWGERVLIVKFS